MKNILLLSSLALVINTAAQTTGKITYEEKIKLNIQIDDTDSNNEMLKNLPKEKTSKKELVFNSDAALYKKNPKEKQNNGLESEHGEGKIVIKMDEPDDCSYADLKDRKIYDQREFMSRQFLIESKFDEQIWKLTGNEKSILGYPCQEAVLQDTNKKAIAWFTAAIPVSIGPNGYCNLPGLILSVDVNGGDQMMTATHVDLSTVDSKELSKPKEGKKMSKPEFRKMVAEKQKEMQEENGGGNNVIIRIKK